MISTRVLLHTQPDDVLAVLAAAGSERAFETLVRRHRRALLAYSRRLVGTEGIAEDIVQQALLAAWRSLAAGTEVQDVRAWLYRITHNQAMTSLRRSGSDDAELSEAVAAPVSIDRDLDARLRAGETLAAVAALPQLQRRAIILTALDGRSQQDAAAALGLTDDAVRGLVYRARAALRSRLAAVVPAPVLLWAAARTRTAVAAGLSPGTGLSETATAGGSAGGAAIAVKAAAVIASSAAVVGGTVGGALDRSRPVSPHARSIHPAAAVRAQATSPRGARSTAGGAATTSARAMATSDATHSTGATPRTGVMLTRVAPGPAPSGTRVFTASIVPGGGFSRSDPGRRVIAVGRRSSTTASGGPIRHSTSPQPAPGQTPSPAGSPGSGSTGERAQSRAPAGQTGTPDGPDGAYNTGA